MQDGGVGVDTMLIGFSLDLSALPKLSCSTDRTYKCLDSQCLGGFVFRRVQEGYHGETAITREQKHFSKFHDQIAIHRCALHPVDTILQRASIMEFTVMPSCLYSTSTIAVSCSFE